MKIVREESSAQNRRFVIGLDDGAEVEAVLYRGDTLCISSQAGCAVRCPFCASGANGLARHLTLDELIGQIDLVAASADGIVRATISGVGEPLHNADNVEAFFPAASARGIKTSFTTSGGNEARLLRALHWPHNGLTLSIHAGTENTRKKLVPHGPSLDEIFGVLAKELPKLTRHKRKKTALAYLVLAGENDSDAEVDAFIDRVLPLQLAVHLYQHNAVPTSPMQGVTRARYEEIYERMRAAKLLVRMSSKARLENNGGCGTLVALRPNKKAAASSPRPS